MARTQRRDVAHIFSASYFVVHARPRACLGILAKMRGQTIVINYEVGRRVIIWQRFQSGLPGLRETDKIVVSLRLSGGRLREFGLDAVGRAESGGPFSVSYENAIRSFCFLSPRQHTRVTRGFPIIYCVRCGGARLRRMTKSYPEASLTLVGGGKWG